MDATEAWKFLQQNEPGFARRPDPEPVKVTVTFGPKAEFWSRLGPRGHL